MWDFESEDFGDERTRLGRCAQPPPPPPPPAATSTNGKDVEGNQEPVFGCMVKHKPRILQNKTPMNNVLVSDTADGCVTLGRLVEEVGEARTNLPKPTHALAAHPENDKEESDHNNNNRDDNDKTCDCNESGNEMRLDHRTGVSTTGTNEKTATWNDIANEEERRDVSTVQPQAKEEEEEEEQQQHGPKQDATAAMSEMLADAEEESYQERGLEEQIEVDVNRLWKGIYKNQHDVACTSCGAHPIIGDRCHATNRPNIDWCRDCYTAYLQQQQQQQQQRETETTHKKSKNRCLRWLKKWMTHPYQEDCIEFRIYKNRKFLNQKKRQTDLYTCSCSLPLQQLQKKREFFLILYFLTACSHTSKNGCTRNNVLKFSSLRV